MSTYVVVQDGSMCVVKLDDASGPVIAAFSNKLELCGKAAGKRSGYPQSAAR
jgi:hypothetical protein